MSVAQKSFEAAAPASPAVVDGALKKVRAGQTPGGAKKAATKAKKRQAASPYADVVADAKSRIFSAEELQAAIDNFGTIESDKEARDALEAAMRAQAKLIYNQIRAIYSGKVDLGTTPENGMPGVSYGNLKKIAVALRKTIRAAETARKIVLKAMYKTISGVVNKMEEAGQSDRKQGQNRLKKEFGKRAFDASVAEILPFVSAPIAGSKEWKKAHAGLVALAKEQNEAVHAKISLLMNEMIDAMNALGDSAVFVDRANLNRAETQIEAMEKAVAPLKALRGSVKEVLDKILAIEMVLGEQKNKKDAPTVSAAEAPAAIAA